MDEDNEAHASHVKEQTRRFGRMHVLIAVVVVVLLVSGILHVVVYRQDEPAPENTPKDAVRDFLVALNGGDLQEMVNASDLKFVTDNVVLSRAMESLGNTPRMEMIILKMDYRDGVDADARSLLDNVSNRYREKTGIEARDMAIVRVILRDTTTNMTNLADLYCMRIENRWYICMAHTFWDEDGEGWGEAEEDHIIDMREQDSNSTHWNLRIISGDLPFNETASWFLEKNGSVVANYAMTKDTVTRQTMGPPEDTMVWYDNNNNWILDAEDAILVEKPDDAFGEYAFVISTDKTSVSFVLYAYMPPVSM